VRSTLLQTTPAERVARSSRAPEAGQPVAGLERDASLHPALILSAGFKIANAGRGIARAIRSQQSLRGKAAVRATSISSACSVSRRQFKGRLLTGEKQ